MFRSKTGLTSLPATMKPVVLQYSTLLPVFSSACAQTVGNQVFRAQQSVEAALRRTMYLLHLVSEIFIQRLTESVDRHWSF